MPRPITVEAYGARQVLARVLPLLIHEANHPAAVVVEDLCQAHAHVRLEVAAEDQAPRGIQLPGKPSQRGGRGYLKAI